MKTTFLLKQLIIAILLLHGGVCSYAQVTIGEDVEPQAFSLLELSTANKAGGLRLPQLTEVQRSALSLESAAVEVKAKAKGLTIYNADANHIEFWDGSQWVQALTGVAWNNVTTLSPATSNTQDIYQMGKIGIGTSTIEASAVMQVESTNKGILLPKVTLNSNQDNTTVSNPIKGLLVYNTGAGGLSTEGYLFWDGTEWLKFATGTASVPSIDGLQCNDASINPSTFVAGTLYNGVMRVPYTGGNGGSYPMGTNISSTGNTGLTATLQAGSLEFGNGELTYTLTGTPFASSPTAANFGLNFLGQSCTASVSGDVLAIGKTLTFIGNMPNTASVNALLSSYYPSSKLPTMDGLQMNLAKANSGGTTSYVPMIFNVSSAALNISYQTFATASNENKTALNMTLNPSSSTSVDFNDLVGWSTSNAEVVTVNIQVTVSPGVWRWYEMKWWAMEITGSNQKTIFLSLLRKA